jgi:hypothetical protein
MARGALDVAVSRFNAGRGKMDWKGDMELEAFKESLGEDAPQESHSRALAALWHEAKGDWDKAHHLAQSQDDAVGAWVHAYLHRVEGDNRNAAHWYRRAGKPQSSAPLNEEWDEIATALL